tara:strand:- start:899 stop:1189 length:291 start_codon:yes stop_codon:yes gene_type:complete
MKKKSKTRLRRPAEFKREALALADQVGVPEAASILGLNANQLYSWRRARQRKEAESESARDKDAEIARLKRELAVKDEELAIVKKAAAYFAKEGLE